MLRDVGVIVPAAGAGARAGGGLPKQFRDIAGVPVLLRAIRPFLSHREVGAVAVALPADVVADPPEWLALLAGPDSRLLLTTGGETRSASVRAGLAVLPPSCRIVLVHDAARPFPVGAVIDRVIEEARSGKGAVAAVRVTDTLKEEATEREDGLPVVSRTVSREHLWRAQTPQGFPRDLLTRAHAQGPDDATDDAALVERAGGRVVLVPDSARNLKVTTAGDFLVAEALAEGVDVR